jgi:predicted nucleotidyltransferase component of viral defense system
MFANKLCALAGRIANRDLYDVYRMETKGREFSSDIIKKETGKSMKIFFSDLEKHIKKNFRQNTIL